MLRFLFAFLALALLPIAVLADTLAARVVGVHDGDTITVLDADRKQHRIRLAGIDAPESHQAFGNRSKESLSRLVFGQAVKVEWQKRDRYGRIVGKVWVISPDANCRTVECPKTLDANLAQVTVGMAWHYKEYEREQSAEDRERYAFAEQEARARKVGLWLDTKPIPPWEWRRNASK
jgi:endonuclease YncB( thermonuclease family)